MAQTVFIDGGAGTTGLEIAERLGNRSEFELMILDDTQRKDPQARRDALNAADYAILCLPDDAAREAVAMIDNDTTRVIDASSAHRVASGWTYGFPELVGHQAVANAMRVSNPGCYPTGFLALIAPLVRAGLLPEDWPYTINAVSGYSGGGKAMIAQFEANQDIAFRTYGLTLDHKHLPEMQRHAGLAHAPIFAPSVIPAMRGMLVEVPLPLEAMRAVTTPDAMRESLQAFYAGSQIVQLGATPENGALLLRRSFNASDRVELHVFADKSGSQARLIALLDNLGKGASGAAVQSLNIMAGVEETMGLRL